MVHMMIESSFVMKKMKHRAHKMIPTQLIWSVLVILVTVHSTRGALVCEGESVSKWFLPFGERHGDQIDQPNNQKFQICQPFNAFGQSYNIDGFKVSVREGRAAGTLRVYPKDGFTSPGSFEIRVSRAGYSESSLGKVHMRASERPSDLAKISRIINEAYPCLERGDFNPNVAFIATFTCMLYKGQRDTFQAIVAVDAEKMYVILNYFDVHLGNGLQFAFLDLITKNRYNFVETKRARVTSALVQTTNGIRPGTWVFDVTGATPARPEACAKTAEDCTVTNFGSIHTFDGFFNVAPANVRRTISKSLFASDNVCNVLARVKTQANGDLKYVDFSVGSYVNDDVDTMVNFAFDRKSGIVQRRGPDLRRAVHIPFPFTWEEGDNKVTIVRTALGWVLESTFCGYRMEYRPNGPEPEYRLTLGEDYTDEVDGLCGNYDGDVRDDF